MSRFDYVKYDDFAIKRQEMAKEIVIALEHTIDTIPWDDRQASARSRALALQALEECYMWIGKAVRDDQVARNAATALIEGRVNS